MAGSSRVWRCIAVGALTALLGFVAACGDDDGATPTPPTAETGTITGNVKDDAGNNIVGAQVATNPTTTFTLSDASGNFTIPNVPAGSVTVIASKEGFAADAEQVSVPAGGTATVNLVLVGGGGDGTGILSGIVLRRDGSPVAGAPVDIIQGAGCDGTPVTSATTDDGGGFLIEGLAPGTYLACVTALVGGQEFTGRVGFVITGGAVTTVTITIGRDLDQTTEPNVGGEPIELDTQGRFNGIIQFVDIDGDGTSNVDCNVIFTQHLWVVEVIQDLNADGIVDEGEPLVSGVRVEWSLNQSPGTVFPLPGEDPIRGTTGVIVDSDDPFLDPVQAEQAKTVNSGASPQFLVDATHAVTYTNDGDQAITFNGETVTIGAGRTWIAVTSSVEGFTDVVAFSPDLTQNRPCTADELGTTTCPDKVFGLKRWVNWRIQVAELSETELETPAAPSKVGSGGPQPQGELGLPLLATIAADGDTLTNRLDRTPRSDGADCAGQPDGTICTLDNFAFIGVVLSRLRLDSPFTFTSGTVDFAVTDDSPDSDVFDIDSDEDQSSTPGSDGFDDPTGTASDDEGGLEANGTPLDNLASAAFDIEDFVVFECDPNPDVPDECLDVDVVLAQTNSFGQDLQAMGFTITTGVVEEAAVAITIGLDQSVYFAVAEDSLPEGFFFSDALDALVNGQADDTGAFSITVFDEFGEICDQIDISKRWVTSIIQLFKQGPTLVSVDQQFSYIVTAVNDGDSESTNVIVADTLPIVDIIDDPLDPGDRDGNQAFQYVTDTPTFDPAAIRYYIDENDDEPGVVTDVCFEAPSGSFPVEFPTPALCPAVTQFPTIEDARAAAQDASADGDQVVIVEYFDFTILARTQPGGDIEAEDSFEVTLLAFQSVNDFRNPPVTGPIPLQEEENGEWCNIATVTSAENDFAADTVCTRVVEALLEVRKTANDAIVPAGDQTSFTIEIANNGSEDLTNVVLEDTLDANLDLVMEENLCTGCTIVFNADSTIITITVPTLPPTDLNGDGVTDDTEFFPVVDLVVTTPLAEGQFCNRVTGTATLLASTVTDSDLACVVTTVEIEFDIQNADGLIVAGAFTDVETFNVGDTVAYQTLITNRSDVAATNVEVFWNIAADNGLLQLLDLTVPPDLADPAEITCDTGGGPTGSGQCTVVVASLAPDASIALNYRTLANLVGNDVNQIILDATELSNSVLNEEPTTVNP